MMNQIMKSQISESEEDGIVNNLMDATARGKGRCGIRKGGIEGGIGRGRGMGVRGTREGGRGGKGESKERDGINDKYK